MRMLASIAQTRGVIILKRYSNARCRCVKRGTLNPARPRVEEIECAWLQRSPGVLPPVERVAPRDERNWTAGPINALAPHFLQLTAALGPPKEPRSVATSGASRASRRAQLDCRTHQRPGASLSPVDRCSWASEGAPECCHQVERVAPRDERNWTAGPINALTPHFLQLTAALGAPKEPRSVATSGASRTSRRAQLVESGPINPFPTPRPAPKERRRITRTPPLNVSTRTPARSHYLSQSRKVVARIVTSVR